QSALTASTSVTHLPLKYTNVRSYKGGQTHELSGRRELSTRVFTRTSTCGSTGVYSPASGSPVREYPRQGRFTRGGTRQGYGRSWAGRYSAGCARAWSGAARFLRSRRAPP